MEKIKIYGIVVGSGDGSAYPRWYLTENKIEEIYDDSCGGMGEMCIFSAETFIGSDIYEKAVENEKNTTKHEFF